jgi:hypothetical protein
VVRREHESSAARRVSLIWLTVFAGEQGLAAEHLSENATHTPHVNRFGIFLESQHNFRSAIPSCCDVFGHEPRIIFGRSCRSGQAEIADFQIAVCVEQEIRGFEIAVEDVCRVHSFEGAEGLVYKILTVIIR